MNYDFIQAWGNLIHSTQKHIDLQKQTAAADNAPETAIFFSPDVGQWATIDQVASVETRERVQEMVEQIRLTRATPTTRPKRVFKR